MAYFIKLEYTPRAPTFEMAGDFPLIGFSAGIPLDAARFPDHAIQSDQKKLCDVFPLPGNNAVSERFREVVESFEPGVHQFMPIELRRKDGTPYDEKYYIFNACQTFDAVLKKGTGSGNWRMDQLGEQSPNPPLYSFSPNDAVISTRKVNGRQLWKYQFMGSGGVFISQALGDALKQAKIKYLWFQTAKELDMDWVPEQNAQPLLDWIARHPETEISIND